MENNKRLRLFSRMYFIQWLFLTALFSLVTMNGYAQGKAVTGKIIDSTGEPVIGASVLVKGTSNGVISDIDGNFSLQGVANDAILQISFVGYKSQEISVAGKSKIDVTLVEDTEMLDEVVVVGYGVQKKSDVTGALASVSSEELNTKPVSNAFEALQGKAAGVDITSSQRPGELGDIRIRGNRSLNASNSPLYVVDGVPLNSGGIETINPRDIESIDILKDASSTAIYGSRGANGVILITTKRGKTGALTLNYSGSVTFESLVDKSPAMSASDYITWRRWAYYNSNPSSNPMGNQPNYEKDQDYFSGDAAALANVNKGWVNGTWDGSKVTDTDWGGMVTQTGITHETYPLVKDYILQHRKEYSEFFKQNNILTYQELNEQYTDITNFIIKTQKIPSYIKDFAKQFILRNKTVFRYWYSNFKLRQYQSDAELKHKTILNQGLSADDFSEVTGFIKERIDIFSEFCQDHGLLLKSQEISGLFHQGNFLNPKELSKFSNTETISTLRNLLEQFIRRNGYIYRNSLVQQHIKCKETEADILLKKFTQQGITLTTMSIAHKFILNNKPLFNNDLYNGTDADNYSNDITINLKSNGANKDVQKIAKNFILHHRQNFIAFINTPHNIENYITSIAQQLEKSPEKGELYYWGLQYISQNQTDFLQYLEKEKIGTTNIESLKKQFANYTLSQNIKMICEKENTVLQFKDGYTINIPIAVHHINAVQDSFEQYHPQTAHKPKASNSVDAGGITQDLFPILPAANYFENLSGIIDDPYHIRFFHGLDKTEKFDNWERYIGRIYPQNKDIVFFGGLAPEDQLTYDYSNDERTKRYRAHTEKMIALNAQERKKDTLAPETAFYIVTGSRQGRG